jgi:purine-binding chemotaxis protein CheW
MIRPAQPSGVEIESEDSWVQLFAFTLDKQEYAIDLMRIEEILKLPEIVRVPGAPPFAGGVMSLRGAVIPVVDLRKWLNLEPAGRDSKCLICRVGRRRVGMLVDGVQEAFRIRRSHLKPLPGMMVPGKIAWVVGVCGLPERPRLLFNLKAFLRVENPSSPASTSLTV